jgi:CHAD domain-containing protein
MVQLNIARADIVEHGTTYIVVDVEDSDVLEALEDGNTYVTQDDANDQVADALAEALPNQVSEAVKAFAEERAYELRQAMGEIIRAAEMDRLEDCPGISPDDLRNWGPAVAVARAIDYILSEPETWEYSG